MNFNYISQVDERDCGAACLAMISSTFGHDISVSKARELEKTNLDGSTALGIKKAAEKIGLETKAIKADMSLFDDYKNIPYPFIVHVNKKENNTLLEHYYVIYKATKNHIYIADPDPDVKKTKMDYKQFSDEWTGIALFFAPKPDFEIKSKNKNGLKSFFSIILKQKRLVTNIVLASLFVTIVSIIGSYFLQILIDDYIPNDMVTTLNIVVIGIIISYIFQQIIKYVEQYLLIILGQRLSIDLVLSYVKHLFELPMSFFYTRRVGEITSRFNDANTIIEAVASSVLSILLDVGIVIIMSIVLFSYNANMFFISSLTIPIYILIIYLFAKPFHKYNLLEMRAGATLQSSVIESINGMETIKSLGSEDKSYDRVDKDYVRFLKQSFKKARLIAIQEALKGTLKLVFEVLILWYGSFLVMNGKMTLGQLIAYNSLLGYFTNPLQSIIDLQSKVQTAIVAAHRLNEVYSIPSEYKNQPQTELKLNDNTDIDVSNVSFEYQYDNKVLNNLSLKISNNEKIALVGISGSGKSTLAKLLVRFYDVDNKDGKIIINGVNIKNIAKDKLRKTITYVPQEPHLFTGKIIDNLMMGSKKQNTFEDVIKATEIACIRNDIENLPKGFETEISETGSLSGGQKQRLSLARALLTDSKILILDESTSNLDILTEKSVIDNLMNIKDKTIIFVAHRLTIAERVSRVVMLSNGIIVADGSHKELVANNKYYKKLVNK